MSQAIDQAILGRQLAVGEWMKIPTGTKSKLSDVYASPAPGPNAQTSIMDEFSGGCYDYSRKRMIITGGGHSAYYGNDMYDFFLDSADPLFKQWRLKLYYSNFPGGTGNFDDYGDVTAAPRHTFDSLVYNGNRDKITILPGGSLSTNGGSSNTTWECNGAAFSASNHSPSDWTKKDNAIGVDQSLPAGYDIVGGVCYVQSIDNAKFYMYDGNQSAGNQWVTETSGESQMFGRSGCVGYPTSAARLFFSHHYPDTPANPGLLKARNLSTFAYVGAGTQGSLVVSGDVEILNDPHISMDWDTNGNQLVLWGGNEGGGSNRNYYTLASPYSTLVRHAGIGDVPTAPNGGGTYGRFAYLGSDGVNLGLYFLVNQTTEEPYILRASAAGGGGGNPDIALIIR